MSSIAGFKLVQFAYQTARAFNLGNKIVTLPLQDERVPESIYDIVDALKNARRLEDLLEGHEPRSEQNGKRFQHQRNHVSVVANNSREQLEQRFNRGSSELVVKNADGSVLETQPSTRWTKHVDSANGFMAQQAALGMEGVYPEHVWANANRTQAQRKVWMVNAKYLPASFTKIGEYEIYPQSHRVQHSLAVHTLQDAWKGSSNTDAKIKRTLEEAAKKLALGWTLQFMGNWTKYAKAAFEHAARNLSRLDPEYKRGLVKPLEFTLDDLNLVAFTSQQDERSEQGDFVGAHSDVTSNDVAEIETREARDARRTQAIVLRDLSGKEITRTFSYQIDAETQPERPTTYRSHRRPKHVSISLLNLGQLVSFTTQINCSEANEYTELTIGIGTKEGEVWISSSNARSNELKTELERLISTEEALVTPSKDVLYRLRLAKDEQANQLAAAARREALTLKVKASLESERKSRLESIAALKATADAMTAAKLKHDTAIAEDRAVKSAALQSEIDDIGEQILEERAASTFCGMLKGLTASFRNAVKLEREWTYVDHKWARVSN